MADFLNDPIGSKYGCSYRYTTGALGTFGALLNEPVNPRKVKDPMPLDGADFMAIDPPFAPVVKIGSYIQLLTTYTYPTNTYVLGGGTEEISKEQVDFSKFKKVINFTSLGKFTITAIPKDQLLVSKNLVDTSDFQDNKFNGNVATEQLYNTQFFDVSNVNASNTNSSNVADFDIQNGNNAYYRGYESCDTLDETRQLDDSELLEEANDMLNSTKSYYDK